MCVRLDLSFYEVDCNRTGLIFLFIFCFCVIAGQKSFFFIGPMRFYFILNFRFSQIVFCFFFLNNTIEIFESDGQH